MVLFLLLDFACSTGLLGSQAATISAVLNLGAAAGQLVIGIVSDRYGRIETAGVLTWVPMFRGLAAGNNVWYGHLLRVC